MVMLALVFSVVVEIGGKGVVADGANHFY